MKLFIQQGHKNRFVGEILDGRLIKKVSKAKHLFRTFNAWAIDANLIETHKDHIKTIEIVDKDTNTKYISSLNSFLEKCFKKNFGYGDQFFLSLPYWQTETNELSQLKFSF